MIPKYRAWSENKKVMSEVKKINFWSEELDTVAFEGEFLDDGDVILMQSTGFLDDLSEEIFEGDVILWTYWDGFEDSGRAKIIFENGMFKLLNIQTGKEVWNSLFDCIENCNVYLQGNIYENKEMLEVE